MWGGEGERETHTQRERYRERGGGACRDVERENANGEGRGCRERWVKCVGGWANITLLSSHSLYLGYTVAFFFYS